MFNFKKKPDKYRMQEVEIGDEIYYEVQILLANGYSVCKRGTSDLRFKNERMVEFEVDKLNNMVFRK